MEKERAELTREQKREERLNRWISPPGVTFRDAKAEKTYKERVTRMMRANRCEEPDRVPVSLPTGH